MALVLAVAVLVGFLSPAQAGGPFLVTSDGQPFRWDPAQPLRYAVRPGPVGSRSHAWAVDAVKRAFQTWQNVPTAQLQIKATGELTRSVTADTLGQFLNGLHASDACPILFDDDGSIMDALLGNGASGAVLGIGAPYLTDAPNGRILLSIAVLNGSLYDQYSDGFVFGSFVHELGHCLNLAHSQVNADQLYDGDPNDDGTSPVMFYRGPNGSGTLHQDDQSWISWLYPTPGYKSSTGAIRGRVLLPDGQMTGLQGVHVIARRVGDPQVTVVSAISGFLFSNPGGGSTDPARLGEFLIPGLPPGSYTLELQPLGGFPSVPVPATFLPGGPKFWRDGSSGQDLASVATPIVVSAGQEVTGVDVMVNADSLGEPKPVAEQEPNELPDAQPVTLPAVISGELADGPGAGRSPQESDGDRHDVYRVTLREVTTLTAILTAARPDADLDLNLLYLDHQSFLVLAESTDKGAPVKTVQTRLPPGQFYFGVHLASGPGSPYMLRLLATPSPQPDDATPSVWMSDLLVGDVTRTSAALHWQTTGAVPEVVYYNLPLREIGTTQRGQEHAQPLTDLTPATQSEVQVSAPSASGVDQAALPLTTATAPAAGGEPRIVTVSNAAPLDFDLAEVVVQLSNSGDGDALKACIDRITVAPGWKLLSELYTGARLPDTIVVGGIGAGGAGAFVVRIIRLSGNADPDVIVHGSYTDAAGTQRRF